MNNMEKQIKLKVYYDGLCKVCSQEINHYKKQQGSEKIEFIDICSKKFDAHQEAVDPIQVHKIMHARRNDGSLATRVDAFIEIWSLLPKYQWLAQFAKKPLIKFTLETGYSCFAAIRPFMPRYSNAEDCKESPYCEVKNV